MRRVSVMLGHLRFHSTYPKTSPHEISHHQCNPDIDPIGKTPSINPVNRTTAKDSYPEPASDRALTPSRTRISRPLATAREQRPYRAPSRNVTYVIHRQRCAKNHQEPSQNKEHNSPTKHNTVACPRNGPGLSTHWSQSGG